MDLEYDRKFEEMKKYIPFLESMIKRLENTSSVSNPRQAQLDKIRSLRDLLMDKKKRMKMENLLKCEQVLVNLYEKVEQRDSLPGSKKDGNTSQKDKADLNTVRNKLKSAVTKLHKESVETLPEIARASEREEVCVPGSKEPALFQRRPNKSSISPTRPFPNKITELSPQMSKRNYTRILLSPEPNQKPWAAEENSTEKPLFSRRSPRRRSPSYHRKERKKLAKSKTKEIESKDLNITLNVPEESLNSLNTKDILSRIINCSDNDVNIDTLRELRTQILGELKETGANEDISDLILKSYKKKGIQDKKSEEIEEGELSDSESEAIESIYGSLVIMDKEKLSIDASNKISNEEKPRKIQICLVINSDKNKSTSTKEEHDTILSADKSDFETYSNEKQSNKTEKDTICSDFESKAVIEENKSNADIDQNIYVGVDNQKILANAEKVHEETQTRKEKEEKETLEIEIRKEIDFSESKEIKKPNFYKPIVEQNEDINKYIPDDKSKSNILLKLPNEQNNADICESANISTENSTIEIPLLEPTKKVSEIDILQALKKEILSETNNVLSSDVTTPPLHQPKITKVVNAHEIGSKKRISIENYKAKTNTTPLKNIFGNEISNNMHKDDVSRKQSLKLTEKECERFNFPPKLTLDESSDDEDKSVLSMDDIYGNLAPKSPDHEDFADTGIKPPVIIPSDPVQSTIVSSEADIDMRKILPVSQSKFNTEVTLSFTNENTPKSFSTDRDIIKNNDKITTPLFDPRMKKDIWVKPESPNPYIMNVDKTSRPVNYVNSPVNINLLQNVNSNSPLAFNVNVATNRNIMSPNLASSTTPNITPNNVSNLTPIRNPNVSNLTPTARSYDMTPSRQTVDNDDFLIQKHVYAPLFPIVDTRDHCEKQQWDSSESNRLPFWEDVRINSTQRDTDFRDTRNISVQRDTDYRDVRSNSTQRDIEYNPTYEQYKNSPRNDRFNFDKVDPCHRTECPTTPSHPFGRLDCPATPTPSFGRMDAPMTPVHPFGRSECPSTPSHPFGRPEPLLPMPFVRPDFNQHVSSQPYGKPLDPRLNRNSDYDKYHNRDDDRDRCYFQEPKFNANSYKSDHNNRNNNPELFRRYQREQSIGRNERNKNYDHSGRNYRDSRRETSVGRYSRDYDNDRLFSRNRGTNNRSYDYRHQNEFKNYDENDRRSYQREKSISRTTSRSSTRDSSVGRTFSKESQLSVQRHTGPSFTIDTSINTTFQENNNRKNSFDARRQRAASVGRTLGRPSSPSKVHNHDLKQMCNNLVNKNNFRRACSVGREIKDSKLDFKDIKADLKSFKLKDESRWSKEEINKEGSGKPTTRVMKYIDPCTRKELQKDHIKSDQGKLKYSPRKNYRDPRMRRENSYENKSNYRGDHRSKSKESKSYGIVYSNDNITKGTILGPGYGVKNYKIPKIKRPEETEIKIEDSESKSQVNANIEADDKLSKNKKSLDTKTTDKKESSTTIGKSLDSKNNSKTSKVEVPNCVKKSKGMKCDLDSSERNKVAITEKSKDVQDIKQKDSETHERTIISCKKEEVEENTSPDNVVYDSVENVEKRITRSASKNLSMDSSIEISPVKRTKKGKKPFVYESDSDDNDKKVKKTISEISESNQVVNIKKSDGVHDDNSDVTSKKEVLNTKRVLSDSFDKSNDITLKSSSGLDTGFGIDDLEIFSDNITSDPVIDNINALIADLDHDLDSSKTVDTKNNFTRELTLETMLENITSPENNEKKQNTIDVLPENLETEQKEKVENKSETSNTKTSMLESDRNNSKLDIINEASESQIKHKSESIETKIDCENFNMIEIEDKNVKSQMKEMEANHNNEAIVSTSEDGEKQNTEPQVIEEIKVKIQTKPDSTINSNVSFDNLDSLRNLPDSTNELNGEMNSVISSTHNTPDTTNNKVITEPSPSNATGSIENIGKLLSILQDKSKIKELLDLLGDQSSENEKIKKKLEKLSEIVSDDEENIFEEKESVKLKSNSTEQKLNASDHPTVLQQEKEIEIANEECNHPEILKQSVEDNKNISYSLKENNDEENNSLTNKENTKEIKDSFKEMNNEVSLEKEDKISMESEVQENKIHDQDDVVLTPKETQLTSKRNKNAMPKRGKRKNLNKVIPIEERRLTRSDAANFRVDKPVVKKPSRELQKLQEDIREMFIRDDILSATGIRMCRLAKLVDETKTQKDEFSNDNSNQEPVVVLEKCNNFNVSEDSITTDKITRKKTTKVKKKLLELDSSGDIDKNHKNKNLNVKLGSSLVTNVKTKLKEKNDVDPYIFETDSINEANNTSDNKFENKSSESENESIGSSKSFGSTELLAEIKKKVKRKRVAKGWQAGIIKSKNRKKKTDRKSDSTLLNDDSVETRKSYEIPDLNCFTDKSYCFSKNLSSYDCRLCSYQGVDIVHHYKKLHPHSEIPLSRMSPTTAMEAIKESEKINFQVISKVSSKKYICRFCFKEFGRNKPVLELFFWHVVSLHTGEYKQLCSECLNVKHCPFHLDIPPPPKDNKGQLLGYVCEKCNYTQISLENLKTHVINRHNDEQTAVYTINLSVTTKSIMNSLLTEVEDSHNSNNENHLPRVLRSSRSNQSLGESSDIRSDTTDENLRNLKKRNSKSVEKETEIEKVINSSKFQSKITFENDNIDEMSNYDDKESSAVKIEPELNENQDDSHFLNLQFESDQQAEEFETPSNSEQTEGNIRDVSNDIFDYPHFKIKYSESGSKEYICCINGKDLHYRTTLLISFKKHVQLKHTENWDGYCFICKVIVTPQGVHLFKDCLQHFLDQHIDNFPVLEETSEQLVSYNEPDVSDKSICENVTKSYINVRPLSELISKSCSSKSSEESAPTLPVIESVISLGAGIEQPRPSPSYPITDTVEVVKQYRHEEAQAEIMSKKHRVVLEAMMSQVKLIQVFKCAGRFCSFTTDSAEDALLHASTHKRVGGEDSLKCVYCDFDSSSNAIDLITHVFKNHGCCQYVCGMCFYRAAASQLVNAHIKRVHANAATITILHTILQTAPVKEDNILSREAAVPYYLCCASSGSDAPCKFRTYTPGKFCEHLQMRHASSTEHSCFMCSAILSTPTDLIRHLKTHGLKLYQCTWCVFGADNETELLAHASANHPDKQPKAYLRIITNKEGTSEFRVLPLAHLNKSDIPAIEIKSSNFKENPVREAERSIELEKLIGHTTLMIESMAAGVETTTEKESTYMDTDPKLNEPLLENLSLLDKQLTQKSATPPPQVESRTLPENQLTPIIKTEKTEITPEKPMTDPNVVYCLDSEEEDANQNIIDLSNDRSSSDTQAMIQSTPKILPPTQLFLCGKCNITLKCASGFKRHIMACYSLVRDLIPCAHCSVKVNRKNIVTHYTKTHAEVVRNYACSKCPNKFTTLAQVREHERNNHPINSNTYLNADKANTANNAKPASTGRRKRSLVNREKVIEPPEKVKKFGPHDVSLLPINPILDDSVFCSLCEFSTKVRLNMVRHLQLHAEQQIVSQTAPVNPVPHLETNEKHFDKMLNLASSSIVSRTPEKNKVDGNTTITLMIPPEAVPRYPKYVPEKHRHTCGAKDCSYISVDESMFKCHWETLHSGTSDYRCVHCPPHQQLDTSKPLTAIRIIAHLKMHDTTLYACSLCSYYHYKRQIVEKHLSDIHKGGQVMVVREEISTTSVNTSQAQISAPTMDLKPWLCGLCKFKSLLRPEVVDHCAKVHNSKMQFKCAYCAFRTSNSENITKHQYKSHPDKKEEIFYYYYREGSVPENPDGTPLWQKQSQKCDVTEPNIKSEMPSDVSSTPQVSLPLSKPSSTEVDLNLVKKEVVESPEETIEDLCKDFGEFCEPNGLKYKCSLCKNVVEDNLDAMQSHLYEELKYRKWGCSICSYKAFHKAGLSGHMQTEHRQNKEPIALQVDHKVETWVAKLLEYQTELIGKNKENLAKQKEEIFRSAPGPSRPKSPPKHKEATQIKQSSSNNSSNKPTMVELERLFGSLGVSVNMSFCCPKCHSMFKDEDVMKNHLENELNKIRWYCSNCSITFQTYHEAQFHCRSVHIGQSARPVEATRDPTIRSAWVEAVIRIQKLSMNYVPLPSKSFEKDTEETETETYVPENSLLVVRYEERIPTPEEQMARKTPLQNQDSDDDKLIIDEPIESRKTKAPKKCPHCEYCTLTARVLREHVLRHYNLRPYTCAYCDINGNKRSLEQHQRFVHQDQPINVLSTPIPAESPSDFIQKQSVTVLDTTKLICLVCRNTFTEVETATHVHDKIPTSFGRKGDVVVKCCICFTLHKDVNAYFNHHKSFHAPLSVNYVFSKLVTISNESKTMMYACSSCDLKFSHLRDLKIHCDSNHGSTLKYTIVSKLQESLPIDEIINLDEEEDIGRKRNSKDIPNLPPSKKVAKKSTTKLPFNKSFARKSTTKLPFDVPGESEEFSYYGTKPSTDDFEGVTTMMSFCNTMVPFTFKKLNEIININPIVIIEKLKE